ncbi:MAG: 4'-phosphopantetheinyl transferase superfamily protein [Ruminococcus sp.]|nr:4'-phosphopantetheinyl transferase superfamily protein [Ruminococcus sp.]
MLMISMIELDRAAQHAHAHALLRECLKKRNIAYPDAPLCFGENGKPYLAERPDVFFNLSHAKGIAVCLVADAECGADCERVRKYRPNVARRSFSESERALIGSLPESERDMMFTRIWTLKEAYVKALGTGISYPLSTVSFGFSGSSITSAAAGFDFRQYIIKGQYIVSTCIKIPARGNE